jgi:hypothetical protein
MFAAPADALTERVEVAAAALWETERSELSSHFDGLVESAKEARRVKAKVMLTALSAAGLAYSTPEAAGEGAEPISEREREAMRIAFHERLSEAVARGYSPSRPGDFFAGWESARAFGATSPSSEAREASPRCDAVSQHDERCDLPPDHQGEHRCVIGGHESRWLWSDSINRWSRGPFGTREASPPVEDERTSIETARRVLNLIMSTPDLDVVARALHEAVEAVAGDWGFARGAGWDEADANHKGVTSSALFKLIEDGVLLLPPAAPGDLDPKGIEAAAKALWAEERELDQNSPLWDELHESAHDHLRRAAEAAVTAYLGAARPDAHQTQELRERMHLIERFAAVLANPACDGDCDGSGIDEEGAEWSLCECALKHLQRLEAVAAALPERSSDA